jgi:hypothetical protein
MTKLLVAIHVEDRARLEALSKATGASQQSLIRNGIQLILQRLEEQEASIVHGKKLAEVSTRAARAERDYDRAERKLRRRGTKKGSAQ